MSIADHVSDQIDLLYAAKGYKWPTAEEALGFLATELGEAFEHLLAGKGFVRNHPESKPQAGEWEGFSEELGDIIMMAMVAGMVTGHNPLKSLLNKINRKVANG